VTKQSRHLPVDPRSNLSTETAATQRLDRWLWAARFFRSRSAATRLCTGIGVRVNRRKTLKPAHSLRIGDVLTFPQGGVIRVVRVLGLALQRGGYAEARQLYEELSPAPAGAD
jgi:ribosome-associated heat shock protein Hsp15